MSILTFNPATSQTVRDWIQYAYCNCLRVRVWYGDSKTGEAWHEEYDVTGRIKGSTGTNKIPLLVNNSRSHGGSGLLDHCIVRIDAIKTRTTLYVHPNFNTRLLLDGNALYHNGELHYRGPIDKVTRLYKFLQGERYPK